jgi:hypothetical protein
VLHGGVVLWGTITFAYTLDVPEFEFELTEVELLDPNALQSPEAVEPPPEPAVAESQSPPTEPEGTEPPQEPAEPERDLGKRESKADELAPEGSTFYSLLAVRKLRRLAFREIALDVMAPLPDFDYLITRGGFDPLHDFDHIVIASPEIRDPTQTFLAVDYTVSRDELRRGIERAAAASEESIEWIEEGEILRGNPRPIDASVPDVDPRWFVLLEDNIGVYVREEFLPHVLSGEHGSARTAGNYVANLAKLRRFANRLPTVGLQVVLKNIRQSVHRRGGSSTRLELPDNLELTAEATPNPEVMAKLSFASEAHARTALAWWNTQFKDWIDHRDFVTRSILQSLFNQVSVDHKGAELVFWTRMQDAQIEGILGLIADGVAKGLRKSPAEIEAARKQRIENWKRRQQGKLPPSAAGHSETAKEAKGARPKSPSNSPADESGPDGAKSSASASDSSSEKPPANQSAPLIQPPTAATDPAR